MASRNHRKKINRMMSFFFLHKKRRQTHGMKERERALGGDGGRYTVSLSSLVYKFTNEKK